MRVSVPPSNQHVTLSVMGVTRRRAACRCDVNRFKHRRRNTPEVVLDIKPWGNNLGVRLPASVARAARLKAEQTVRITVEGGCVIITPHGDKPLTLDDRLALFDPSVHGGEAMAAGPETREVW